MDGVISDTQWIHANVESNLLKIFGIDFSPEELTEKYAGVKSTEIFKELLKGKDYDLNLIMRKKWEEMAKLSLEAKEIPGAINFIRKVYEKKLPLAVASASNIGYVKAILNQLKIKEYFRAIISGDMVQNGKPDPEIFLLAASKIEVNPKDCLVIEDARSGMQAAKAGGMFCIGLVKDKRKSYPTKNLVISLNEITDEYLERLRK